MSNRLIGISAERFAVYSAIAGILLAALLAQTGVLAFGSFRMMAAVFVVTDLLVYLSMRVGLIRPPSRWSNAKD